MTRNWTEGQLDAIRARGGTLLVSAAAGSGKTAVLVQRVIERITDPVHPADADRLLVVTFTKAAAAEMRGRISAEISRLLESRPFDSHLQRQQLLLSHAHISTIDSFCSDLVHQNFFRLGISPEVRILDESELSVLRSEAADETLEEFYEKDDPDFYDFVESFPSGRDDAGVAETVRRLYGFVRSHPFPERWLREKAALYENPGSAARTVWGRTILSFAEDAVAYCISVLKESLNLIDGDETVSAAYGDAFRADMAGLQALQGAVRSGDWDRALSAASNFSFHRLKSLRGRAGDPLKDKAMSARREVKTTIGKLADLFGAPDEQCREDVGRLCPIVNKLFEVTRRFSQVLDGKKAERRAADFSDLEHWTLRLLVKETPGGFERTPEAAELADSFDEIMVDEYQDTNETQDMIFRALSRDESNLFLVGDVKQSIYRFRQAMPQIFLRRRAEFQPYDRKINAYPACVVLGRNFRSRPGVTDAVNFVFRQLMSRQAGELDYTKSEELVPAADYPPNGEPDAELDILDLSGCEEKDTVREESRRIAGLILQMTDGTPRITEKGALRPAVYRDFCVLLRSANRPAHDYVRELTALGIPAWADTAGGFFEAYEVGIALSLLRVVDNPVQDIPLLSVMMSPIYGFTADDMARIRLHDRSGRLYPAVAEAAKNGDTMAADFLDQMENFRMLSAAMPSDRLIRTVFEKTGFCDIVQAMPNGELRLANLRLLLEYAKKYEASGYNGLTGFLRFLDRLQRNSGDMSAASALTESANVVRVMSIHHSKGLEFPVCIVAGCARRFNRESPAVLLHPELGLGARLKGAYGARYNTMPRAAVALELERDDMSEELRVLYVAMTRAKEKLVLLASLKDAEKTLGRLASRLTREERIPPYVVRSASSIADWLLLCALRHPDGGSIRRLAGVSEDVVVPAKEPWKIRLIRPGEEEEPERQAETIPQAEPDTALEEQIAADLDYRYPYAGLNGVCAKAAASELAAREFSAEYAATSRPAFLSEKGLTPAERGTALHAYLQFADYRKALADPRAELHRLVEEKYLTEPQAQAVDLTHAEAFFGSPVMRRVLASPHFEREFRFTVEIPAGRIQPELASPLSGEAVILQGSVDLVFEEDGGLVLVDFKTDRTRDTRALWNRYREQLALYRFALERCTEKPVKQCLLYSFYLDREVTEGNSGSAG
ncbi:MAG: helicase-exonuclease AddAB subunit AddA [Oscillospiraceae bacterium]|jgi:ATP-dependent helicase/nuclease subunit A|nr:helicase-exonuclease AddAB subunit AddA [Oscillospiraceae bacterium]MCI1991059.1 helicase-exonuclease AddAB subunit AddA [Oscillospiraceae bacterium]MCI2035966.1 helicase-exonuclease AddAB subunit AddA [Oscillospiraceae bacterium]